MTGAVICDGMIGFPIEYDGGSLFVPKIHVSLPSSEIEQKKPNFLFKNRQILSNPCFFDIGTPSAFRRDGGVQSSPSVTGYVVVMGTRLVAAAVAV